MAPDPWLERWLPLINHRIGNLPILELGCGTGLDTTVLDEAGHRVIAIDLSPSAIAAAGARAPACEFYCQDIRGPFPNSALGVNVVVASLSLHYFAWEETLAIVDRIRGTLAPHGLLLCRLNSTNDHNYGATGHPEIERNYYRVNGQPKRFFDRAAVDALFSRNWTVHHVEERVVHRYRSPKELWEVILEKAA